MSTRTETSTVPRQVAWTAYASAFVSAIGWVFLIAMFASFAVGATSPGLAFGRINDVLVVAWGLLALPLAVALHSLLRQQAPILSGLAMMMGIGALAAIIVLQWLLLVGALTFDEQVGPVSIAFLVAWFITTGYLGRSSGTLPDGLRMGLLAATSVGYAFWAVWLARRLMHMDSEPVPSHRAITERHLATNDE